MIRDFKNLWLCAVISFVVIGLSIAVHFELKKEHCIYRVEKGFYAETFKIVNDTAVIIIKSNNASKILKMIRLYVREVPNPIIEVDLGDGGSPWVIHPENIVSKK
jgi:hypothetical protein